jgi:hypothetical protein
VLAYFQLISIPEVEYEESYLTLWVGKVGYRISYPTEKQASIAYEWLSENCRKAADEAEANDVRNPWVYVYGEDNYSMMDMVERFMNVVDGLYHTERLER